MNEEKINTLIGSGIQVNINLAYQLLLGNGYNEKYTTAYIFRKQIEYFDTLEEIIYYFCEISASQWTTAIAKLNDLKIYIHFSSYGNENYISLWRDDIEIYKTPIIFSKTIPTKEDIIEKIEQIISYNL